MSLDGKTIVFTGTLNTKRADATRQAREAGATVTGSVSGKTDILVAGAGAGAKMAEAQAKGVEVWTEDEFLAALSGKKRKGPAAAKKEPAAKKGKAAAAEKKEPAVKKAAAVKKEPAAKKGKKAAAAAAAEEEEEEEEVPPVKKEPKKVAAAAGGPKVRKPDRSIANGSAYTVMDDYDVKLMQTNIGGGQNNNKVLILF